MKRQARKLRLQHETIATLNASHLERAIGGVPAVAVASGAEACTSHVDSVGTKG